MLYYVKHETRIITSLSGYLNLHACECSSLTDVRTNRTASEIDQSELNNALIKLQ
jgi:hypothetical protein